MTGSDGPPVEGTTGTGTPWVVHGESAWLLGAGLVLVAVGAVAGRPDVALVGLVALLPALRVLRPVPRGEVWVDAVRAPAGERPGTLVAALQLAAPPGTDAVRLRLERPGRSTAEALVRVPLTRRLEVEVASARTGPQDLVHVQHRGLAAGGRVQGPPGRTPAEHVVVLPRPVSLGEVPLPRRLRGLAGRHPSRRPGDGGDLRDVHPFQPGDDSRRVDWKATARRSPTLHELHVRRTYALAEATVVLVVDSRDDVGPDPATWSGIRPLDTRDTTSLDVARQAAATVAQAYLAAGDRVAVEDLGRRRRALRAGAGRRQLDRVVHQLATTRPEGVPPRRVRAPHVPTGALVVLFSTFLDDEPVGLARVWARSGHRVVVVDTLPRLRTTGLDDRGRLALRIVQVERADRLAEVRAAGGDVVPWAAGDVSLVLQRLARAGRRPGARS